MQNTTFKNSTQSFSELRHQILIIFVAKCRFTPVLSTYKLLSKSYDAQKLYFEKSLLLLNCFRQIGGFGKAGGMCRCTKSVWIIEISQFPSGKWISFKVLDFPGVSHANTAPIVTKNGDKWVYTMLRLVPDGNCDISIIYTDLVHRDIPICFGNSAILPKSVQ